MNNKIAFATAMAVLGSSHPVAAFAAATPCQQNHLDMGDGATTRIQLDHVPERRGLTQRLGFALHLVTAAFPECTLEELGINVGDREKNYCSRVLEGEPLSEMCFLQGTLGTYFVHVNLMDVAVVDYNRWD